MQTLRVFQLLDKLKACLISGPYKPGKCGISDYIKLLSHKLEVFGNSVALINFVQDRSFSNKVDALPKADFYSVQFAPYSFSCAGLSGRSLINLGESLANKVAHINFHEIWIGAYPDAPWIERYKGWRQKREILRFLEIVNPRFITCSNAASMDRIAQAGIQAKYLYLFGNVPYAPSVDVSGSSNLRIALFGTPYQKFPYNLLAEKLTEISASLNKPVEFRIIGRQRVNEGIHQIRTISKECNFSLSETGELTTHSISIELQSCDLGLCTTPYDVLGKSGATAAMLEHGLPVIAFDDGDTPKEKLFIFEQFSDQVFLLKDDEFTPQLLAFMQKKRKPFFDGVAHTTEEMLRIMS